MLLIGVVRRPQDGRYADAGLLNAFTSLKGALEGRSKLLTRGITLVRAALRRLLPLLDVDYCGAGKGTGGQRRGRSDTVGKAWRAAIHIALDLGDLNMIADLQRDLFAAGVPEAIRSRETATIYDWLVRLTALQGISDASAFAFAARQPPIRYDELSLSLAGDPACQLLTSYWQFRGCGFSKDARTCSNPSHLDRCLVPRLPARNGRLSQSAVSLALFMRDVCAGDFVGWIDDRLTRTSATGQATVRDLSAAVLEPLTNVYGVGSKVLSMVLADLLLAGDLDRELWVHAGAGMIAIDSLVHNFLHRTGALSSTGRDHPYGPRCYGPGGCAELIEEFAASIDAREINSMFPAYFPRFIQHSIWRFCAASGWNICNGNKVQDDAACIVRFCPTGTSCQRHPLRA